MHLIGDEKKRRWYSRLYLGLGSLMIILPLATWAYTVATNNGSRVFFLETAGIIAFSLYWLVKTFEMRDTEALARAACGELEIVKGKVVPHGSAWNREDKVRFMQLHEEAQAIVRARAPWNQTGVALVASETYDFVATGCWTDLVIPHGPTGDPSDSVYMRFFERWRRVPVANWFTLIGTIDAQMQSAFVTAPGVGIHPR